MNNFKEIRIDTIDIDYTGKVEVATLRTDSERNGVNVKMEMEIKPRWPMEKIVQFAKRLRGSIELNYDDGQYRVEGIREEVVCDRVD